jgi:hypothetical protein
LSAVAALGVTNLNTDRTTPTQLATLVRQHWGIEVRRDVALVE